MSTEHDTNTTPAPRGWNPRYIQYARSRGHTPEEQMKEDRKRFPGGPGCGFILFMSEQWQAWKKMKGYRHTASGHNDTPITDADHAEFDRWLMLTADLAICKACKSLHSADLNVKHGGASTALLDEVKAAVECGALVHDPKCSKLERKS